MTTFRTFLIYFLGLATFCALGLLLTACVSTTRSTVTTTSSGPVTNVTTSVTLDPMAASLIEGVTAAAVPLALQRDTNAAPYLEFASQVFLASADSAQYDPAKVQAALSVISVKELRDPTAQSIVTVALGFYKGSVADALQAKVDASTYGAFAEGILRAIAQGITDGMASQ